MNRRSFFRTLAKGVLAAAATIYAPRVLLDETEVVATRIAEAKAFLESMERRMAELLFYGEPIPPTKWAGCPWLEV